MLSEQTSHGSLNSRRQLQDQVEENEKEKENEAKWTEHLALASYSRKKEQQ